LGTPLAERQSWFAFGALSPWGIVDRATRSLVQALIAKSA
jgi:hypothetical protein